MSDDDSDFGVQYENGHWEWSDDSEGLVFISNVVQDTELAVPMGQKARAPTGAVQFKEDLDVMEQMRFRYKYQRKIKPGEPDVITIQDIRDVVIYTAPLSIISPTLINILHAPTTERFIRALILYCQYYLQVTQVMEERKTQMATRIRTPQGDVIEGVYRENLCDLRALCAKEYCTIIIGGNDTSKFHHLRARKSSRSLSDKDAHLMETLVRSAAQLVWLALGRHHFTTIELEVNRLFKTDMFNSVEHNLRSGYLRNMSAQERGVLLGHCVRRDRMMCAKSPLHNEISCLRNLDYRLLGLGVIKYHNLPARLRYLELAISGPEEELVSNGISLGILGLPRSHFDPMLNPNKVHSDHGKGDIKITFSECLRSMSKRSSRSSNIDAAPKKLYPDIELPPREHDGPPAPPEDFPDEAPPAPRPAHAQRRLWLQRLLRKRRRRTTPPPPPPETCLTR